MGAAPTAGGAACVLAGAAGVTGAGVAAPCCGVVAAAPMSSNRVRYSLRTDAEKPVNDREAGCADGVAAVVAAAGD